MTRLILTLAIGSLLSASTFADEWVGKIVFPRSKNTPLRYKTKVVSEFSFHAKVLKEQGDWIEIRHTTHSDKFRSRYQGYVRKKDVVLEDDAVDYFTTLVKADASNAWAYKCRAEARLHKGENDLAIADLTEALRLSPNAASYNSRGLAWHDMGEYDKAIADYDRAIRLDPKDAVAYNSRGASWANKGEYDKAIADYNETIRLDPKDALAYKNRGISWRNKRVYDKAIADFNEAIRLDPKDTAAHNYLAWLLATCPSADFRDGDRAVELATKACGLTDWKVANFVDTLAAAYAESGDFENAVRWQEEAVKLAPNSDRKDFSTRVELYKAGKVYGQVLESASTP